MIRSMTLTAVLAAGLAAPALAADPAGDATTSAAAAACLKNLSREANANEVRKVLMAKGYTSVSSLTQDDSGRWLGTAEKDGRTVSVGVAMPPRSEAAPSTN